jgi:hypothetical protein
MPVRKAVVSGLWVVVRKAVILGGPQESHALNTNLPNEGQDGLLSTFLT